MTYQVVQDFVADDLDHLEGLLGGNGVDEHVPVDADAVAGVEDGVFILRSVSSMRSGRA